MGRIFKSDFHDEFGSWPLAYIPYGGADFGEIVAVGEAVGEGDDGAFYQAWMAAGDRIAAEAEAALSRGRREDAQALFLRASCFYATSYHPIYGEPVDARVKSAFTKLTNSFDRGMALFDSGIVRREIPFEGASLPAYFIPAAGRSDEVRPLLILTNGYDSTIPDLYFASAVEASRRGYHCLLYEGPGQGAMLIERGVRLRPDWETVVRAVVDYAVKLPKVDTARIAISGGSLGGYLSPRGASGEPRVATCIADPGLWSMAGGFRPFAMKLGATPEEAKNLGELGQSLLDRMWQVIENDRRLHWSIVQRGFWVHGVSTLREYLRSSEEFTMEGRAELIRCPMLMAAAERDVLSGSAQTLYDALKCPKTIMRFTAAEGAGTHCEMGNRTLFNRRMFEWLDGVLGV